MSSSDTTPGSGSRPAPKSPEEMSKQIDELRSELQNLTSKVTDVAGRQLDRAQQSLESSIRNNPIAAVAIAAGVGFLYAMIRR